MERFPPVIEEAITEISRLPGIGRRSAQRLVLHLLLRMTPEQVEALTSSLTALKTRIYSCPVCFNVTEDPEQCSVCADPRRRRNVICVVESVADLLVLERTGEYQGLYHVLGGVISPLEGVGPGQLHLEELWKRCTEGVEEVIVATNPTVEGDATANFLARRLHELGVRVTRPARGIPLGGNLDYVDHLTLARSFNKREEL